jgi:hypothetical protein
MRIHFERGGGFAPTAMRLSHTVETQELPATEAAELRNLVSGADIAGLAGHASNTPPRPDAFHYRLTIEDDAATHQIVTSDADMPAALRPLVSWLTKHAARHR